MDWKVLFIAITIMGALLHLLIDLLERRYSKPH